MKLEYFYGSIIIKEKEGSCEPLSFAIDKSEKLTFRYPYGDATPEEAEAIGKFVKTITDAYNVLTNQIDRTNKDLKLEQYAPTVSAEETTEVSAVPQSCALGDEEVSTGVDGDIDKAKSTIAITKATEDDWL